MFAPFSQARFGRQGNDWVLELTLSRQLLIPFAIFIFALIVFRAMGPMTLADVALILAAPFVIVGVAILDCRERLKRWWNLL